MTQSKYSLQPRTYKTVIRVIDDFYEACTQKQQTPTLIRFISYVEKRTIVRTVSTRAKEQETK